jgi:hypothetical protein
MNNSDHQCCCHCGQPHKQGSAYCVIIGDKEQAMCCPGCQAVASLIVHGNDVNKDEKRGRE